MELSIDSSTRYASIAVSSSGEAVAHRTWRADRNHSVELAPAIRAVMSEAALSASGLEAVFVARGPGGFSSLRVGIAMAKALAMGLGVPLTGVGTLEIELAPYLPSDGPVCALVEAGGGRLYAARSNAEVESLTVVTVDELAALTTGPTLFLGEAASSAAPRLTELLGDLATFSDAQPPTRNATTLARLGWERSQAGESTGPDTVEPIYMKSAQYAVAARTHLG